MFDGHNGGAAAVYAKENLLRNVLACVPADLTRDEWLAAPPRALVAGFVKTDKDFQTRGENYFPYMDGKDSQLRLSVDTSTTTTCSTTAYCHI
jgi:hypothetical protein